MGITGLIPFVASATSQITLNDLTRASKNVTVAVDSYCFLHKGAYSCSDRLIKGMKTTAHIDYCMKFVNMLLRHQIKPIMVFDGRNLPAKQLTEKRRRSDRDKAKEKAQELMREGKVDEARREYSKAVDITHDHAVELMKQCHAVGVDCIVAMYEADSQLAYLNKIGLAEFIVSEDSDLILFGAQKILFKLQLDGRCTLFESSKLPQVLGIAEEKFDFDKFRRICILSGCDYLDNLPGIGLSKAKKFMLMTEETNMKRALLKIPSYLNMRKLTVTDEYVEGFLRAEATFKHMYVFDPVKREMLRLNPLGDETDEEHCCNAGSPLEPEIALQIALGNMNPRRLEVCNDFNPDKVILKAKKPNQSIWTSSKIHKTSPKKPIAIVKQQRLSSFFTAKTTTKKLAEVQNIAMSENEVTTSVELTDLVSSYCFNAMTTPPSSSKRRNDEQENVISTPKAFNPFSKQTMRNESSTVVKKVSKYFVEKTHCNTESSTSIEVPIKNSENLSSMEAEDDSSYSTRLQMFAHVTKPNLKFDKSSEKMETENESDVVNMETDHDEQNSDKLMSEVQQPTTSFDDDIVDVESYQSTAKSSSQSSTKSIRIGLSKNYKKPTKKQPMDTSQTLLSRFGFEKRTSVK